MSIPVADSQDEIDITGDVRAGRVQAAIDALHRSGHPAPDAEVSRIQLKLRRAAFDAADRTALPSWPRVPDHLLAPRGVIPEITAADLTPESLVDGVVGSGSLIVRGLLTDERCTDLRSKIDTVLAARTAVQAGERSPQLSAWYERYDPDMRTFAGDSAAYVIDSPRMALEIGGLYQELGIVDLVAQYLGERPSVSLRKWVLRRVPPTANTGWHQDGNFMGESTRNVNLWISLSDCGDVAPGLELTPFRLDEIVESGTGDAAFDWSVGSQVVDRLRGDTPIAAPVFKAGDAVFFDHMCLHRTGVAPGMTQDRYAIETWFFAPSHFPADYTGFLL